ncbi:MAG: ABC transporter permease [Cellvibrionaceae bacterium]
MKNNTNYRSDFKYTLRLLAKKPGFTLLSILVLAGGLGISIITTTLVDNVFYREVLLPNGENLYRICAGSSPTGCRMIEAFEFAELRKNIKTLDNVSVLQRAPVNVEYQGRHLPIFEAAASVEWTLFQTAKVKPLLGRTLQAYDHEPGAEPVVVIGHGYWQGFLGGDENVVGSLLTIQSKSTKIVGVMPEGFRYPDSSGSMWLPISESVLNPSQNNGVGVVGYATLKPGETRDSASNEIRNLMKQMRQRYPTSPNPLVGCSSNRLACDRGYVAPHTESIDGTLFVNTIAIGVTILTSLIFLLACLNVGTLLLARTNERLKDVSIRVALGAPRLRLLLQTMGESVMIVVAGGALALLFAGAAFKGFQLFISSLMVVPIGLTLSIDASTLLGTLIYLSLAVLLTSILPCWKIVNGDFNTVMRDGTRGAIGLHSGKFSRFLVTIAIAMITLLIFVGTIGMNYAWSIRDRVADVNTDNIISTAPTLGEKRYSDYERLRFFRALSNSLAQDASIENAVFESVIGISTFEKEVEDELASSDKTNAVLIGLAGSLSTLGGTVLEGREFGEFDIDDAEPAAVISRNAATKFWPNVSPIGKRIRVYDPFDRDIMPWRRVVGVVSEMTSPDNLERMAIVDAAVYLPLAHLPTNNVSVSVKAKPGSIDEASSVLLRNINALDNQIPLLQIQREDSVFGLMKKLMSFLIALIGGCALFSLLVAVVGIYGLTQNSVNLLTQEIGTRRALGATDKVISRSLLLRVSKQLVIGVGISMAVILPIISLIFVANITPIIIIIKQSFVPVTVALAGLYTVMLISIYQPIRNMLRLEPSEALRQV